jgi:hypothetical protein
MKSGSVYGAHFFRPMDKKACRRRPERKADERDEDLGATE